MTTDKQGPVRVLIVEDNPDDVELATEYFTRTGVEVAISSIEDSESAIALLKDLHLKSDAPEFVLLDLNMPKIGGMEILKLIRERDKKITVVIYSGSNSPSEMKAAKSAGADGYIVKPMFSSEMDRVVEELREMLTSIRDREAGSRMR